MLVSAGFAMKKAWMCFLHPNSSTEGTDRMSRVVSPPWLLWCKACNSQGFIAASAASRCMFLSMSNHVEPMRSNIYMIIYTQIYITIYITIHIYTCIPLPISTREWEALCPVQSLHLSNLSGPVMGLCSSFCSKRLSTEICKFSVVGCLKPLWKSNSHFVAKKNHALQILQMACWNPMASCTETWANWEGNMMSVGIVWTISKEWWNKRFVQYTLWLWLTVRHGSHGP